MKTARRFEDLLAWQRARALTRHIYSISSEGPIARDFSLKDQLRRAAVSCMSNLAEGLGRKGDRQFAYFIEITTGSAAEVQSLLYVALDGGVLDQEQFEALYAEAGEVTALSIKLLQHLRRTRS